MTPSPNPKSRREEIATLRAELQSAKEELARWMQWSEGQCPDQSAGDVIAAYADGTIVLDDSITTWNPKRALAHFEHELMVAKASERLNAQYARSFELERDAARAELQSAKEKLDTVLTDVNYEGGLQWWIAKHSALMLENIAANAEIERLRGAQSVAVGRIHRQISALENGGGTGHVIVELHEVCKALAGPDSKS